MQHSEHSLVYTVLTSGAIGGLTLLSAVAVILAFDVFSIATLLGDSANRGIVSAVLLGGALTKGVAFGAVAGIAFYASGRSASRAVAIRATTVTES